MKKFKFLLGVIAFVFLLGIVRVNAEEYVAEMNGKKYSTFLDVWYNLDVGDNTLTLLDDMSDNIYLYPIDEGRNLTIDLNGHNLSVFGFSVDGASLEFKGSGIVNLALSQPITLYGSTEKVDEYTTLTVGKDVTLHSTYTGGWFYTIVHNNASPYNDKYGVKVNFNGKIDGEKGVDGVGLYVSGNYKSTEDVFNVGSTSVIKATQGIYAAGDATWNLSGKISSELSGVEIRAGRLNITGGEITATYIPTEVTPNGNGTTTDGAAIAIAQHTTKLPITVNISGGTFKGYTPLYESNPQNNDEESVSKVKLNITGGTFNNIEVGSNDIKPINSVYSENFTGFITGGTYSNSVSKYIKDGYHEKVSNGKYIVTNEYDKEVEIPQIDPKEEVKEPTLGITDKEETKNILLDTLSSTDEIDITNKDVKTVINIEKVEPEQSDINSIKQKLGKDLKDSKIVDYFDISIDVIDSNDGQLLGNLTKLNKKIKFTVALPENLQKAENGYVRNYYVVKKHADKVELIKAELSSDGESIIFETDEFSTFALAYEDVKEVKPENPNTFDGIKSHIVILGLSLICLSAVVLFIKKKKFN